MALPSKEGAAGEASPPAQAEGSGKSRKAQKMRERVRAIREQVKASSKDRKEAQVKEEPAKAAPAKGEPAAKRPKLDGKLPAVKQEQEREGAGGKEVAPATEGKAAKKRNRKSKAEAAAAPERAAAAPAGATPGAAAAAEEKAGAAEARAETKRRRRKPNQRDRERRKQQQKKEEAEAEGAAKEPKKESNKERNARKKAKKKRIQKIAQENNDPSLVYMTDPRKAPTVGAAKRFFCEVLERSSAPFKVTLGPVKGWRTQAKLAVRTGLNGPKIGLFAPGSHDVVEVSTCVAHHASINKAVEFIQQACGAAGVKGYNELMGSGDLRYIKLDVQRSSGLVQLSLVWHAASQESAGERLKAFVEKLQEKQKLWYSIWVNFNKADGHVSRIFSHEDGSWKRLAGSEAPLREKLSGVPLPYQAPGLCFPPFVFRQANLDAFGQIVAALRRFVPPQSRVVECYGGVGTIGLHLADLAQSLVCSDENPHNQFCFKQSVKDLPKEFQSRVQYRRGDAAAQVETLEAADVLIVDPPRKGLDEELIRALLQREDNPQLRLILYVSCGFPALQRDVARLRKAGWTATHAEGFILFPGADHIETFCVLER